jgi:glycosyl transferase family 87
VNPAIKRSLPFLLVGVASAWLSFTPLLTGDYPADFGPGDYWFDAAPAVSALAHAHFGAFLDAHPVMGPFSIVLRAPFAALTGAGQLAEYRLGSFPCALSAGLLGLYLADIARRRGSQNLVQAVLVGLCLFNPLTLAALRYGHPEEVLTAALAVGAVATASEGRSRWAALLLGLAIASKQWAVIATLPALMALPGASVSVRVKVVLGAAAVALAFFLPGFIADPSAFTSSQSNAASTHGFVGSWSVWYPFAGSVPGTIGTDPHGLIQHPKAGGSESIGAFAHPLIVILGVLVPLALALRRRRFELSGGDAMGLLALLALLRCALDPVNVNYYQEPLLLAIVGWDALSARGLPNRALFAAAVAFVFWRLWPVLDPHLFNSLYLAVAVPAALAIAHRLFTTSAREPREEAAPGGLLQPPGLVAPTGR